MILVSSYFWPFTEVMRKIGREVTPKVEFRSFAFPPCVSMCSRHIATADTAVRPSHGRSSRKVMIIVPLS